VRGTPPPGRSTEAMRCRRSPNPIPPRVGASLWLRPTRPWNVGGARDRHRARACMVGNRRFCDTRRCRPSHSCASSGPQRRQRDRPQRRPAFRIFISERGATAGGRPLPARHRGLRDRRSGAHVPRIALANALSRRYSGRGDAVGVRAAGRALERRCGGRGDRYRGIGCGGDDAATTLRHNPRIRAILGIPLATPDAEPSGGLGDSLAVDPLKTMLSGGGRSDDLSPTDPADPLVGAAQAADLSSEDPDTMHTDDP